ncbi:MAG TPA: HhH-GPD-type base excision DNA repair protein [Candidatus Dormibacteraeota bacterium]|nr:HhH-GPD-type base excision DNA repair protein [Candidatus Dormibacteraeota bacterium]
MSTTTPSILPFTGDAEADALLVDEPLALLIGFVLDQQVTLQKAFGGPLELKRRLGSLDARRIASMDPEQLDETFRRRPALHRFPGTMADRTRAMCAFVAERYDGDAARVWTEASDGRDLERRLLELPGIGPMKAKALIAILGRRLGVRPSGWEEVAPGYPTLGDVDSPEALTRYQEQKRAHKAELRAAAG